MAAPPAQALIADLVRAFPRDFPRGADPGTLRVYLRELSDIPLPMLEVAVRELIRTVERFPPVSVIRGAAAERTLLLPSEEDALRQVEERMRWARGGTGEPPEVHPLAEATLRLVGGYAALRTSEKPSVIRGQWLRLYRDARARELRGWTVGRLAPGEVRRELGA